MNDPLISCSVIQRTRFQFSFVAWMGFLVLVALSCNQPTAQAASAASKSQPSPEQPQSLDFNRDVRPILSENCFHCHGPDAATREADLRLDQQASAMDVIRVGESSGDEPGTSELIRRILSDDPDEQMPPAESRKTLEPSEVETLVRWVKEGGDFQEHWAFRPETVREVPKIEKTQSPDSVWTRNPIDAFVLERLHQKKLSPSEQASAATLIRRVTLDVTGLPPTPDEVNRFHESIASGGFDYAYESLVERLLHSPRYGEHMATAWLEASRYADTDGYQNDRYRYQHVWRDWLIQAYNDNMPYDQFVIEQIAGDMLPNATFTQQVASGFGRNHRINSEDGSIPEEWRIENVVDRVDTLGTVMMGLTIGCARCHDHKYDPISQRDYYQLFAYFNNIAEWGVGPNNGNSPPFVEVPKSWPNLSDEENEFITPDPVELHNARKEGGNGLKRPQAGSPSTVMVMHELSTPRKTFVLKRGQYDAPDESQPVQPGVPAALGLLGETQPTNRLELAQWLFEPQHPLTARVALNRLWQQFFGAGIVESSDNFGSQGSPPSHPELLDWLALELKSNGWDIRAIQRLILLSSTYRQSSAMTDELIQLDPNNRLLARGPRVRMSAFMLRDQALAASGLLVERLGGPSVKPYMPPKIWSAISNNKYKQGHGEDLYRRSLYTYWRRTIPPPTMMNFNAAAREVCIVRTEPTNTPLQALTLMNNTVFVEAARALAQQMLLGEGNVTEGHVTEGNVTEQSVTEQSVTEQNVTEQIEDGFVRVTARSPTKKELAVLRRTYQQAMTGFRADAEASQKLLAIRNWRPNNTRQ